MEEPRRIIRGYKGMKEFTGFSVAVVERLVKRDPNFPRPIKLGERAIGFYADDVARWQKTREEETARMDAEKAGKPKPKTKKQAA